MTGLPGSQIAGFQFHIGPHMRDFGAHVGPGYEQPRRELMLDAKIPGVLRRCFQIRINRQEALVGKGGK